MPRNSDIDYTQYVHEYVDDAGATRYAVARWDEERGQYIAPLDRQQRKRTGCHSEYARSLQELGGYLTKRQALRRARYLFGGE